MIDLVGSVSDLGSVNNVSLVNNKKSVASVSFEDILSQLSSTVGADLSKAENISMQQISGKPVGMMEVVNSVMAAERSLGTAIALRDKIVQAYTEISHMQI